MKRREFIRLGAAGLISASVPPLALSQAKSSVRQTKQPNIVLIMTDEHRRDCVGAYGAQTVRTPHLDRLAAQGVVFEQFYATSPLCAPTRAALATGRYPHQNGLLLNKSSLPEEKFAIIKQNEEVMTGILARNGYTVAQFGVDHVRTEPPLRDADYFMAWGNHSDYRKYLSSHGIPEMDMTAYKHYCQEIVDGLLQEVRYSSPKSGVHTVPPEHFWDTWIADQAASFIKEYQGNVPFALNCFLWLPHPPVVVPDPYYSMYSPEEMVTSPNLMAPLTDKPQMHLRHAPGQLGNLRDHKGWLETMAVYYGMVTMADMCIGRILDALEQKGLMENTLVIFAADHGDQLGSHSLFQKMVCYQESIHLPCIMRIPDVTPGRRKQLASHVDLLPTILDYAGVTIPEQVAGHSLRAVIDDPSASSTDAVFSEYSGNFALGHFQRAVITERYKYIENEGDISEVYDLQDDPYELQNLMGKVDRGIASELQNRLHLWQRETDDFLAFRF
ncbi:sulfatase-like hydrolase/transferase [Candidatus Neomarinimicrobiota bacterium]